jgi:transposase
MEQRYHAVMEVVSGAPVTEVARRYGVSRQAVYGWLGRYEHDGLAGLADHSHRPVHQPRQLDAEIEALICQLRGAHPRWGPRRLLFELGKAKVNPLPSRSTIYRVLVRHGLVPARKRKRRRQDYLLRYAHAYALAGDELRLRSRWVTWGDQHTAHLARLTREAGYQPTAWEQARLAEVEACAHVQDSLPCPACGCTGTSSGSPQCPVRYDRDHDRPARDCAWTCEQHKAARHQDAPGPTA